MIKPTGTYAIVENHKLVRLVYWDGISIQPGGGDFPNNAVPYSQIQEPIPDPRYFVHEQKTIVTADRVVDKFVPVMTSAAVERINKDIETQIERLRGAAITLTIGQNMEYTQKLSEAMSVLADPTAELNPRDYPMLMATEVAIHGRTLKEAAQIVIAAKHESRKQLSAAANVRANIRKQIAEAKTDVDKYNCFINFDFNSEMEQALTQILD